MDERLIASGVADVILSGHDHDLMVSYNGKVAFGEAMQDGLYLVAMDLEIAVTEKDGKRKVSWWPDFRIIDRSDVAPDPDVLAKVETYEAKLDQAFNIVIGKTETELDSRNAAVRGGEAALARRFDRASLQQHGARARREGDQLEAALEQSFSEAEDESGRFPQVSGLTVRADLTRPVGERVVSVKVGDEPLDPAKTYSLVTKDFLARGGDGYEPMTMANMLVDPQEAASSPTT